MWSASLFSQRYGTETMRCGVISSSFLANDRDVGDVLEDLEAEPEVEALGDVEREEIAGQRLDAGGAVGRVEVDRDLSRNPVEPLEIRAAVGADVDHARRVPADDAGEEEDVLEIKRVGAPAPVGAGGTAIMLMIAVVQGRGRRPGRP